MPATARRRSCTGSPSACRAAPSPPSSARTAPASRRPSRQPSACCRCARAASSSTAREITNRGPAPADRRRHLLRAAGAQHLSRAVGAAQSRARRRRGAEGLRSRAAHAGGDGALSRAAPQGQRPGLHALRRRAEDAGDRPRAAARAQADADRRALDRAVADPGGGAVRPPAGPAGARHHGADDRAERQARARKIRLWHRAGARPHAHPGSRRDDPRRPAHRPAVPGRRAGACRRTKHHRRRHYHRPTSPVWESTP